MAVEDNESLRETADPMGVQKAADGERPDLAASVSSGKRQELDVRPDVSACQGQLTAILEGTR